jgi:hypothetical protein
MAEESPFQLATSFSNWPRPSRRELIELRPPVVFGPLPLRLDPALLLQLVKGRIERAVTDLEDVGGHLLQSQPDGPSVQRLQHENLQN